MRVLIVDDDTATVSFMRLAFEAAGDEVRTATTVDDALREAAAMLPDVVLSDLTLARSVSDGADGFALLRALRDHPRTVHIGVLAVSGADHPEVLRAAEERGFDGFVAKPVDIASLIERVHRLGEVVAERTGTSPVDPG